MEDNTDIITIKEAAALLRISPWTVSSLLRRGKLPGKKIGGSWRLSKARVQAHMDQDGFPVPAGASTSHTNPAPDHDAQQAGRA